MSFKDIFPTFSSSWNFQEKKSRTFQEAWESCYMDRGSYVHARALASKLRPYVPFHNNVHVPYVRCPEKIRHASYVPCLPGYRPSNDHQHQSRRWSTNTQTTTRYVDSRLSIIHWEERALLHITGCLDSSLTTVRTDRPNKSKPLPDN